MYLENSKCGKGGTNLTVDFGDLVTQPRIIDTEQGSKNQDVNINDNAFLPLLHHHKRFVPYQESEKAFFKEKPEILAFPHLSRYDIFI